MIPSYRLFQGAVLAELVCALRRPVSLDELKESGRLTSYIVDRRVGLHIKHSAQRLSPWQFTITKQNYAELQMLSASCVDVFIVLVCSTDGMVCIQMAELLQVTGEAEQSWVRVGRRPSQWYNLSGPIWKEGQKKPEGLAPLVNALVTQPCTQSTSDMPCELGTLKRLRQRIAAFEK